MRKRDFLKTCSLTVGALLTSGKSLALEYYPTTGNVEWAVLYGTWCGTSRDASVWISEGMNGITDVFDVRENPDLSKYKYIIVGGSIRSGQVSGELQEYLTRHKESIKSKIRGLFAVCGNMMQPVTQDLYDKFFEDHLIKLTGAANVPSKVFLGRITFGLMEPDIRSQMKSFPNMKEYDNLKRSECMNFGSEILQANI
jgi:menaquinone-dependent protoporphyrinogen IX oxidase